MKDVFIPSLTIPLTDAPSMTVGLSDGFVEDQGITYDQAGLTYNAIGYDYGGFYGFSDVVPLIDLANYPIPSIVGYADIYTPFVPPPLNNNQSLAPGWFMFVTH